MIQIFIFGSHCLWCGGNAKGNNCETKPCKNREIRYESTITINITHIYAEEKHE
jgi:hypothetical protein